MDPETDIPGPIPDANAPLPRATDILISQPLLRSTLSSQGTAAQSEFHNIVNIKWDLEETQTVNFTTMVKMFLVRNRINVSSRADIDGLTNHVPALMEVADAEYRELLEQAIGFCNLVLHGC